MRIHTAWHKPAADHVHPLRQGKEREIKDDRSPCKDLCRLRGQHRSRLPDGQALRERPLRLGRLAGARLATAAEGAEGARMDEAIIKQITGEYVITVRKLYENEFEFTPVAKIWMTTNHEPVIPGTDDGIWRRIWMVPFSVQIPEEKCDTDIAAKLLSESSGILNWCLAGLSRYYAKGNRLVQPRKVLQATANLRTVSDTVGLFLATECTFESEAWLSRSTFREMFEKWCTEEGIHRAPTGRKISMALKERGVNEGGRSGNDRRWSGIRWKNLNERVEFEQTGNYQDVLTHAS
ncbi:MAG: phage/plasmid primase, P4 family [Methanoregula sp.]|nr:phage/plasmid primase, P4 family [Methanoregula sp.]